MSHVHELWLQFPVLFDLPGLLPRKTRSAQARRAFLQALESCLPHLDTSLKECSGAPSRPPASVLNVLRQQWPWTARKHYRYVCIQARSELSLDETSPPESMSRESWGRLIGATNLREAVLRMLVLTELAYPSLIAVSAGHVVGPTVGTIHRLEKRPFYSLGEDSKGSNVWPQLQTLPIEGVVSWAARAGYDQEGIARGRVHRAFAAFTQCVGLTESRPGEVLFRSMQGLEAFYCDGNGDLRKQLDDKSRLWLGNMPPGNMSIGKLYEQRSKVIHGASPILFWPEIFDAAPGVSDVQSSLSDAACYAFRLLVATLQEAIRQRTHEVTWSYSVTTDA